MPRRTVCRAEPPSAFFCTGVPVCACKPISKAAILDDPMECSRGERLSITLAKNRINRAPERLGKAKVEVDIFELLRDSEYETAETILSHLSLFSFSLTCSPIFPAARFFFFFCSCSQVPHFKVAPEEFIKFQFQRFTTLNLHPSNTDISVAVAGVLNFFNCTTACLICAKAECLLNLEKLLRQFLISKDTLSVRMLDDARDPTPLLKEIRDDKTATIIIHANASMSHTILLKLSSALLFDAVYAVVTAVQELNRSQEIGVKPLSCGSAQIWQHGTSLMNYLRMIGQWHVADGLSMDSRLYASNISDSLFNTTLVVTTILENPYLMLKGNHQEMEGNDRYEGFCVDMLKELAEILRFNYKIRLVGDGVYGVPEANGTWTGMVGELIARVRKEQVVWIWGWAFTLIIISSYTANLAAFLTVQRMDVPIESVDDLADQTAIEYGTIHGGSSMTFFQNSRYQTYQRMWNYMYSKQPSVFVKSTEEGIARVLNSNYAFLLESTMNEYYRQRNCNLTQIGGLLDTKGYGIGMPVGSVFRDEFDLAILQLQENNRLEILKRKWWEGGKCPKEEDHRAKGKGGPGPTPAWETRAVSVCQEMVSELRNIILCQDTVHPRRRRSGLPPPRPPIPEEQRRPRGTMTLSNGKLCGAGEPDQLAQRLAQEAALVARGCTHIRVCPECRRFQGLRARPSPARSEESLEWEKTTNSSGPE
ncbi:hypothetical protein FD754_011861 [Muntiacus muntjak]|uniref:Ionotropic glutamate receptor C-terminal domain-containing protein n=1 Tax=Muntiacus muntjak TaxID=9888 RepID=A0A5N3VD14_MUNMU|nr:hypothetical protein FD754_011861 [Muntiacus muntjak]